MEIFNIISGICSIVGVVLTIITIGKTNQIIKMIHIENKIDNSNNPRIKKRNTQKIKGNFNCNINGDKNE